jgi:cell division protein ZapE
MLRQKRETRMNLKKSYENLIATGSIKAEPAQLLVLEKFELLAAKLTAKDKRPSLLARVFQKKTKPNRGIYSWGDVGRGKTMLMDLFFASVEIVPKRRQHFHAFMQDIHARRKTTKSDDVISDIAEDIAAKAKLLCLDEMQISDIADAMIIGRLFEALEQRGVCLVTTSNLPPDQLYRDGLNRQLFLPFIAKLNASLDVIHLGNGIDYRLGRMASRETYITPLGKKADAAMTAIWNDLTDNAAGHPQDLDILGRKLHVPAAAHGCGRFTFSDLCEKPLAAPDYLALAKNFRTIFIDGVSALKASQRNETKRLILMIDTFYDAKTRIVVSATVPAGRLCTAGPHRAEFLRTISRLEEMQSASWWKALEATS